MPRNQEVVNKNDTFPLTPKIRPALDPDFLPAALWNRAFGARVAACDDPSPLAVCLSRPDGTCSVFSTTLLPHRGETIGLNNFYVDRLVKTLLWLKGGSRVTVAGDEALAHYLARIYSPRGARAFDAHFMGEKIYRRPFEVVHCAFDAAPEPAESTVRLGRNLDGCRIGFDLGGSDRKCAALIDGETVFSEEVAWDPYFQSDPDYHFNGINESLKRAAAHLPRVDAIGGSAAGVYVNNEVRAASLFRGLSDEDFEKRIRTLFLDLRKEWRNVPFDVVNDGEVTALAGSMALDQNAVLGVAMGTSEAAGYINSAGHITSWLNEFAFVPIDFRPAAPRDEWSGDVGCGVQYFSQQGVGRLIAPAGIEIDDALPLPEKLVRVQELMAAGDGRARQIYETIGACFGYTIALYASFYEIRNILLLGRVASGPGGEIILSRAGAVLEEEFPELHQSIRLRSPGEKEKRHGQAVAAASLPRI